MEKEKEKAALEEARTAYRKAWAQLIEMNGGVMELGLHDTRPWLREGHNLLLVRREARRIKKRKLQEEAERIDAWALNHPDPEIRNLATGFARLKRFLSSNRTRRQGHRNLLL